MTRSADECEMSRSCQSATFSHAAMLLPRMTRANPQMRSDNSGLRLCGIDDEPLLTKPGDPNGSCTSATSVRCNPRISVAIFSKVAAIRAKVWTNSAWRSLWMIWFDTAAGFKPSCLHTDSSIHGGSPANVPTGPDNMPTAIRGINSASRS